MWQMPFIALTARQDRCGASQAQRHRNVLRARCGGPGGAWV